MDLEKNKDLFKSILENAGEGILIVNSKGLIEITNLRIEELFGYSWNELTGQPIEILLPESLRDLHAKYRTEYNANPRTRPMGQGIDLVARRKDGSEFQVEVSLSYLRTNEDLLIMAFVSDISQRKQAEEELRQERERAQKYLDIADVMLVAIDGEGKITMINQKGCAILGYRENELMGKDWFETCLPPKVRNRVRTAFQQIMKGEIDSIEYFENPVLTKSGQERLIAWHNSVIKDENGNPVSTLSSGQDVTERKQVEELAAQQQQQILQADKMATIGILASGIAHEINNPNNYILLNGKIISKMWNDVTPMLQAYFENNGDFSLAGMPYTKAKDKIGKLISGVSDGAMRIQRIIQSLKDFARYDRGEFDNDVDVNNIVDSAIVIVQNMINKSTDRFSVNYGKRIPKIKGNSQQLEQVIINLITNSCQALDNREKGLFVSTAINEDSGNLIIEVQDEGVGISPDNLKYILDPFFTTKRDSGGTGLGLSVSYNIVKNHGGEIEFSSRPGIGTTVRITLPFNQGVQSKARTQDG
jgi:PAS domain S-box-containing protein